MPSENMLQIAKKALLIPVTENYADDELSLHIASCRQWLIASGVPSEIAEVDDNALVQALIIIFVKTNFGFTSDGSVRELPKSFEVLLRQLCLTAVAPEVDGAPHE